MDSGRHCGKYSVEQGFVDWFSNTGAKRPLLQTYKPNKAASLSTLPSWSLYNFDLSPWALCCPLIL